jgi:hypothetical protein
MVSKREVEHNLLYDELDNIIQRSRSLIEEFQKLSVGIDKPLYLLVNFFQKKSKKSNYYSLKSLTEKLKQMIFLFHNFFNANISNFPNRTKNYLEIYREYLDSVLKAIELRTDFEKRYRELSINKSTIRDLQHIKMLIKEISLALKKCKENSILVNKIVKEMKN